MTKSTATSEEHQMMRCAGFKLHGIFLPSLSSLGQRQFFVICSPFFIIWRHRGRWENCGKKLPIHLSKRSHCLTGVGGIVFPSILIPITGVRDLVMRPTLVFGGQAGRSRGSATSNVFQADDEDRVKSKTTKKKKKIIFTRVQPKAFVGANLY